MWSDIQPLLAFLDMVLHTFSLVYWAIYLNLRGDVYGFIERSTKTPESKLSWNSSAIALTLRGGLQHKCRTAGLSCAKRHFKVLRLFMCRIKPLRRTSPLSASPRFHDIRPFIRTIYLRLAALSAMSRNDRVKKFTVVVNFWKAFSTWNSCISERCTTM